LLRKRRKTLEVHFFLPHPVDVLAVWCPVSARSFVDAERAKQTRSPAVARIACRTGC